MSQMTHFYPLEKLQPYFLMWLQVVTLHLLHMKAWARRVWAAMINEQYHHGAGLLMVGDSLQGQVSLAKVLGGDMEKAMIVQKLHEWLKFNESEGNYKNKRDGCWWTYNSYVDWCKAHFGWMSKDSLGRHIRALEKMGVIRTQQMKKYDREKWYTIDYGRLNALSREEGETLALMPAKVRRERVIAQVHRADVNPHDAKSHDDSSSKPNKKPKPETQTSKVAAIPLASEPDQPRASTELDSDSHSVSQSVDDLHHKAESTATPLPSSAAPLSPQIDEAARQTWDTACHQLRSIWGAGSFDPLLKDARLLAHADGLYTVAVSTEAAQRALQHRYYRKIHRTLEGQTNRPVSIVFEVST